jgi:hypothetical protein
VAAAASGEPLSGVLTGGGKFHGTGTPEEAADVRDVDAVVRRNAAQRLAFGYSLEEAVIRLEL